MSCLMLVNNTFSDSMAILSGLYKYLFDNFIIFAGVLLRIIEFVSQRADIAEFDQFEYQNPCLTFCQSRLRPGSHNPLNLKFRFPNDH